MNEDQNIFIFVWHFFCEELLAETHEFVCIISKKLCVHNEVGLVVSIAEGSLQERVVIVGSYRPVNLMLAEH